MVIPGNITDASNLRKGDKITRDGIKELTVVTTNASKRDISRGKVPAVKVRNPSGGTSKFTYGQIERQFASME